ncbi:iron-containing alcohol dehydrogenase [Planctomicrobium sp. SH664]|uniref:iron-containing alcohol dehydrogenase n=1 Tax=Planctomicrobium sp. SH664 TaxID=3448125 RepID=UPI003F5B9A43
MNRSLEFNLLLPRQVTFGWGRRVELGTLARGLGSRVFLVDGSNTLRKSPVWGEILSSLSSQNLAVEHLCTVTCEPTIADVDATTRDILRFQPASGDLVLAIGGGAALDLAKAVAAMATNSQGGSVRDYLEGVGTGRTLTADPLPVLAVPTTAGTGSEATRNAVISCHEPPCKKSLRSNLMLPSAILIDPELTVSLSPRQTASSGLDAITQLIESFLSRRAQPFTDALCLTGLDGAMSALETACRDPGNRAARETMAYAAFLSGIALANSGLGFAHGVAAALGALCNVPHGLACATLLPIAMRQNLQVANARLRRLAPLLTGNLTASAEQGIAAVDSLLDNLSVPRRLRDLGVHHSQLLEIATGSRGNSLSGNPRDFTDAELLSILEAHW